MEGPRNRKQRRAAAAAATTVDSDTFDPSSIPLARPAPNPPKSKEKTLMDIISERQSELLGQANAPTGTSDSSPRFVTIDPTTGDISGLNASELAAVKNGQDIRRVEEVTDETASSEKGEDEPEESDHPIPPVIDTLLLSVPLTTLHLTLAYLAAHQYAESIELDHLIRESVFVAFPMLTLLVHLAHGHVVSFIGSTGRLKSTETVSLLPWDSEKLTLEFFRKLLFPPALRTMVFLPMAVALGCKLMVITNDEPYYAVMRGAPAIGTIWIWSILEIPFGAAVIGALGPLAWGVWWKGYGIL
ncbi:uncharacterized protein AKAW2_41280A [Aspergillus luchuensis]|uniref:DUF7719 domain-containing protein n=1 Tax=Aspergillus kawachii TaxID=1069201 RepID=A0A146EZI1_ASPKA|nr:uncharacterized protein AKAW2_41280A [Aspergillus luchuensis]BCR99597.1 hypothetical protein AKAW2_41280A [Aspergillus luchuensis]BCS11891.1 hypothetical protein ALUC_41231A [Aspergillus luchuensis]GAA91400.1 hypothetical protein AKAW_09514 [Aspergillus luchuensis IFO 4308]GAT19142.1 hypothetical protein RIB2604_00400740 [Aspergillus luchuensis]